MADHVLIDRAVVQQALEALENAEDQLAKPYSTDASNAITALRAALAQAEPVEAAQKSGEFRVMVCGVDCHPGDQHCNGYCTGKTDDPPEATAEQQAESVQRKPARWTEL